MQSPVSFCFFENWETRELWLAHLESQHIKAYKLATENALESFTIYEMTKVG